ncbi:DUF2341 domain-containing protein [Candidatus Dojkabacteria bacterium]|nr:DUF2341 domain-containing protein [Candidatus Dojkabacteria bacterium]
MKKTIKKYLKKRERSKKLAGFTFLEIILIIAILGVIFIMVIYRIRPIEVYRKAFNLQAKVDIKSIENGVKTFALNNRGKYPVGFTGLSEGTYDICKAGYTGCTPNSVNLDDLVTERILSEIPISPYNTDTTTTYTGYQIYHNPQTREYKVTEINDSENNPIASGFRRIIEIDNNSFAQNDYQLKLSLNTQELIAAGKMLSDCSNLSFTNTSGEQLIYWIEPTTCNTANTKIWFKSPQIPGGISNIFMNYGDAGLTNSATLEPADIFIDKVENLGGFWDPSLSESYPGTGNVLYDLSGEGGNFYHSQTPQWDAQNGFLFDDNGHFTGPSAATFPQESDPRTVIAEANPDPNIGQYAHVFHYGTPAKFRSFGIAKNGSGISSQTWSSECIAGSWTLGVDNTIAVTSSGSLQQIFKNGVLIGTCNSYTLDTGSSNPVQIGVRIGQTEPWLGYIKYVQFYDRVLTAEEIHEIYDNRSYATVNYPGSTLVHKYSADIEITNIYDEIAI